MHCVHSLNSRYMQVSMSKEKIPSRIQADTHKASDMQIVFMGYSKTDLTAPPSIPSPNTGMTLGISLLRV